MKTKTVARNKRSPVQSTLKIVGVGTFKRDFKTKKEAKLFAETFLSNKGEVVTTGVKRKTRGRPKKANLKATATSALNGKALEASP